VKLYTHEESGNSYKVRLLLAFLGQPYEAVRVDLMQDAQHQPAYLGINPRGEVPALVDGELCLRDSAAILVYLAGKYAPTTWWSSDLAEQAQIVEWLAFAASWVQYGVFTARALVAFGIPANGLPPDFPEDPAAARIRGRRSLEILEGHLHDRAWLVAARPTIADLAVFPYIALAPMGGISLAPYGSVRAWIDRLKTLPRFIPIQGLDDPDYRTQT
jgi:glutathione S-transferase